MTGFFVPSTHTGVEGGVEELDHIPSVDQGMTVEAPPSATLEAAPLSCLAENGASLCTRARDHDGLHVASWTQALRNGCASDVWRSHPYERFLPNEPEYAAAVAEALEELP